MRPRAERPQLKRDPLGRVEEVRIVGYNFSDRVRRVLQMAREHAARLGNEFVSPDHILLGLVSDGRGIAAAAVSNFGVQFKDLANALEARLEKGTSRASGPDVPYTSRAKKVLELAMAEAHDLGHDYIGTEHLLLALVREGRSQAAQVLAEAGVDLTQLRAETVRLMASERPDAGRAFAPVVSPKAMLASLNLPRLALLLALIALAVATTALLIALRAD